MLDDIQEEISQGILDSVNKVKEEKDAHYMANPAQLPDRGSIDLLIERCSNQNALISGGTSLIPGPWGMAAAIPEIVMVSKKQIEMIYDIARAHGHKHIDSNLLLSVMLSASGQGTAALVVVHGQKIVMKRAGARVVQQMVELLGGKITQQVAKSMAAKWIPIAGAVAMAAWSRYSTQKIGEKAKETFSISVIEYEEAVEEIVLEEKVETAVISHPSIEKTKIEILINLMKIDGKIDDAEVKFIEDFINKTNLASEDKFELISRLGSGEKIKIDYTPFQNDKEEGLLLLIDLIALAGIDKQFHITEKMFIKEIAKIIGFCEDDVNVLLNEAIN